MTVDLATWGPRALAVTDVLLALACVFLVIVCLLLIRQAVRQLAGLARALIAAGFTVTSFASAWGAAQYLISAVDRLS